MANRPAPALGLREGDREELARLTRSSSVRAGSGAAGADRVAGRGRGVEHGDRRAGRGVAADGDRLAGPVRSAGAWPGWTTSRARVGRGRSTTRRIVAATLTPPPKKLRGDALVVPAAGPAPGDRGRHGGQGVAGVRGAAVAGGDVPVLHRPASWSARSPTSSGCTWPRRRTRSCCASTRSPRSRRWTGPRRCCRCSPGWPNAAPTTTSGTAPRPCSRRWRSPPARSPRACKPRHRHQEFLAFLKQVARAYPDRRAAPGDGQLRRPQAPRGQGLAGRQPAGARALHPDPRLLDEPGRGLVLHHRTPSHPPRHLRLASSDLNAKIRAFIDGWNDRCHPFVWTKTADQILNKANRQKTSNAGH